MSDLDLTKNTNSSRSQNTGSKQNLKDQVADAGAEVKQRVSDALRASTDVAQDKLKEAADVARGVASGAVDQVQDKAREHFDELAGKFGRTYVPGRSWKALSHALISVVPQLTIVDLGAGEGTLSLLLAKSARKVIAIDRENGPTSPMPNPYLRHDPRSNGAEQIIIEPAVERLDPKWTNAWEQRAKLLGVRATTGEPMQKV